MFWNRISGDVMITKKIYVTCVILLLFFLTCEERSVDGNGNEPPSKFEITDFPNEIGFQFTYSLVDSFINLAYDTVTVIVKGDTILPNNKLATIWEFDYSAYTDTFYVTTCGDTLMFYSRWDFQTARTAYIFPIEVGKEWRGDVAIDTSRVIDKGIVVVPAGNFQKGYRLHETWFGFNDFGDITTWLVPKVGIVKMDRIEYMINQKWELIDYQTF
jgi:hypothetical protein